MLQARRGKSPAFAADDGHGYSGDHDREGGGHLNDPIPLKGGVAVKKKKGGKTRGEGACL